MPIPKILDTVDGDALGFRDKEICEGAHDKKPPSKEQEYSIFETAKHGEKRLRYYELDKHVQRHYHALTHGPYFLRHDLTWYEPSHWPP